MPKQQSSDNVIRAAMVANEFGVSRVTLWRWERDGPLPRVHRIKNTFLVPPSTR